jgi:hypothetical protein
MYYGQKKTYEYHTVAYEALPQGKEAFKEGIFVS